MEKMVQSIMGRLSKAGKPILVSFLNVFVLLIFSYVLNNQPLFTGEDLNQYAWMEFLKNKMGLSEQVDYSDALFVNVSYDKQLIEKKDEFGMPVGNIDITDRTKLLALLNILESTNQYRYIILDVRFEKGLDSEMDSALFSKIKNMKRIVVANHLDVELADSCLSAKAAISDYASTIVATNFARYKFLHGKQPSLPLFAYKDLTGKTITKHGLIYSCGGSLCYNSLFLKFPYNGFSEYGGNGEKSYYNMGSDLLSNYSGQDLSTLAKNKLVFIGDMVEDVHDTYAGLKPGTVITYHALRSLLLGEHMVSYTLLFFLSIVFFFISLSLFKEGVIIKRIPFVRKSHSKLLHFFLPLIGYTFVLFVIVVVLNLLFNVTISIIVPSIYFTIQKTILNFKRTKI